MRKFEQLPGDIFARIEDACAVLRENENVVFAYLFGGLTSGISKPLSDVDIAVYVKNRDDLASCKLSLFFALSESLGTEELDLVLLNDAPISLAGRVLQNRRILVDKEPFLRHEYESLTLRKFFDFQIKEALFFAERYGGG